MTTDTKKPTARSAAPRRKIGPCGALYDLLLDRLPSFQSEAYGADRLDVYRLAEAIGFTHQYLYQVFQSGDKPAEKNVSVQMARKLIEISESRLTWDDLEPFLPS